jgi:hypothetical protein
MKNINPFIIVIAFFISLSLSSCFRDVFCVDGKGQRITDTFIVDDFTGVELQEAANVFISQGEEQKVIVTGKENILDLLQTEVKGGIWEIDLGRECFNDLDLTIEIVMPNLNELHISGSGTIVVEDFEDQGNLDISVTGSGILDLNRFSGTEDVDVRISGSGDIEIRDEFPDLKRIDIELTGSGIFDGFLMATDEMDARISGSGDIYTTVNEYINVRITGSGDLHYKGNPYIDANITGSGKIINEN